MFICNCPLCLHCTYSEVIFKLEYKNAVLLNHELVCIQLTAGSKEHIKSLYFSNIKYILMPKILKDKCDRIDFILVQSLQPIPAVINQACVDHLVTLCNVRVGLHCHLKMKILFFFKGWILRLLSNTYIYLCLLSLEVLPFSLSQKWEASGFLFSTVSLYTDIHSDTHW